MGEQDMPLCTVHHREASWRGSNVSLATARNTFELIREAAVQYPEQTAIVFLSGGDRLDRPEGIS